MGIWSKTEFKGVRFRKHPTRKHGVQADRYYVLTYKIDGKTKSEAVGWASEKVKPSEAYELLCQLKRNQKTGQGPRTLAEMRELAEAEKEAERKAREAESQRNITFKDFFENVFLPDAETRWTSETARKPKEHVTNWIDPITGNTPIGELQLSHVQCIRTKLAKAGRSARMQQYVMHTFSITWNTARDHGFVEGPCPTKSRSFRLPRVDNERQRYLTLDEESKLLENVKARSQQVHDMVLVALDAGLRFKEVASLTWGCINNEEGVLKVLDSKGRDRYVPMTDRLKGLFGDMKQHPANNVVFPNNKGAKHAQVHSSFVRSVVDTKLNDGVENPKMRASFHSLRHTFASRLVQAGVDLYRVQRLLGHSTPVMTARYSKLANDDLKKAVEVMEQNSIIKKSKGKVVNIHRKVSDPN